MSGADPAVHHPAHYNSLGASCPACGRPIECIDVTERMTFCIGNAVKYVWRHGLKLGADAGTDLAKAIWYLQRELDRLARDQDKDVRPG